MKPVALITGSAGLIGQYFVKTATRWAPDWEIRELNRADLDLTDSSSVDNALSSIKPAAVIHCAANSRTKDCEQNPDLARRINVDATAHLARLSEHIPFMFFSSSTVFNGAQGWYSESDTPSPVNIYGKTKLEAEQLVLQNPRHTVLRIVLTAGTSCGGDRSFVEDMCRTAKAGKDVTLYADEFRCPLPAGVIARVVWELMGHEEPGLYHLGGSERLSRWEIGQALLPWYPELMGRLVEGSAQTHVGSLRPADLSLRCDKIQKLLSFPLPGFREWLAARSQCGADLWDYQAPLS